MTDEYQNFINQYQIDPIEFRNKPNKIFPPPKINKLQTLITLFSGGILIPKATWMNEPVTAIQRSMGESLRFRNLLDKAAEQTDICERLVYIAAFSVSSLHINCKGRNRKSFDCILGETFEFYDPTDKMALICEQVSINPSIIVSHAQNEKWELLVNICYWLPIRFSKIGYNTDAKLKYKFKNDNQIFISNRPSVSVHDILSDERWVQYKGDQKIKHKGSEARVELTYCGCERYSKENCIKGKIFDQNNKEVGTLEGNYLTKLVYKKPGCEPIILWELDDNDETFKDYFYFKPFTLQMNDPAYMVECPTDSRFRRDIRSFEEGNFSEADRHKLLIEKKQKADETDRKKRKIAYEPKWFKKVKDEEFQKFSYVYEYEYWTAKLEKNFERSPKIFEKN